MIAKHDNTASDDCANYHGKKFIQSNSILMLKFLLFFNLIDVPAYSKEHDIQNLQNETCTIEERGFLHSNGYTSGFCIHGTEGSESLDKIANSGLKFDAVIIDLVKNSRQSFEKLAKKINHDSTDVIIAGYCFFECSELIVPAGDVITLISNASVGFLDISIHNPRIQSFENYGSAEYLSRAAALSNEFQLDPGFWLRPREQIRSVIEAAQTGCLYDTPFLMILDAKYLRSFGKTVIELEENSAKGNLIRIKDNHPDHNIIQGFETKEAIISSASTKKCLIDLQSGVNDQLPPR